jgi:hypothetical protein
MFLDIERYFRLEPHYSLAPAGVRKNISHVNTSSAADWRADLDASRDLSDLEKQNYGFLLSWFESWRVRLRLEPDRAAAVEFWKSQVAVKPRKEWQLERWGEAVRWYLRWLQCCQVEGMEVRSVGERLMGHEDVKTTEIYTHVATGVNGCGVRSPLDG